MVDWKAIILAAGQGKRMKSEIPKVLHPLLDTSMLEFLIDTIKEVVGDRFVVVISPKVKEYLEEEIENTVLQEIPLGTGDAVKRVIPIFGDFKGDVLILPGDTPLVREESLRSLCEIHEKENYACTMVVTSLENPLGYGRVIKNDRGEILRVVEEKDASPEERKIKEVCTSIYAFSWPKLREVLPLLKDENAQKEFYLTDVIKILVERGEKVGSFWVDSQEVLGANTQKELAFLRSIIKEHINEYWLGNGVIFLDTDTTFIGRNVEIGKDVVLHPHVCLFGKTTIQDKVIIGDHTYIKDFAIREKAFIGPFSYISLKKEKQ
ncbi:MAG TPA: NTP transferase domain-containing protein [Dictyoglomaceae bacterium]|nr:NTP transferase domain-containing protein [Dictyoglomaceae bacterium]HOL39707.1 NTP transferase domain-containing protein [Dictyoglomaceae bacterium]HOP95479.1 NTP transferase domain-containing protein [Dictyoglomaceae bacterium]HPP16160.1 NTP transferase domain-containing protein [Dictyoglomaceae bacterium]HPU43768.1 NTP transferase domain-containing protein [Dictyoglomaceae bacterium]